MSHRAAAADAPPPASALLAELVRRWPSGDEAAERKLRIFDERALGIALNRLTFSIRS